MFFINNLNIDQNTWIEQIVPSNTEEVDRWKFTRKMGFRKVSMTRKLNIEGVENLFNLNEI